MNGHDLLADLAARFFGLCASLFHHLNPAAATPIAGRLTYEDLAAAATILVLVCVLHGLSSLLLNRRATVAHEDQKENKRHFFNASTTPSKVSASASTPP